MPITKKQLERRRKHIGASDVPAILGLSQYKTKYDIWAEKTGKVPIDDKSNPAAEAGNMFEDGVLKYAEAELGKLIRNQFRSANNLPIACNCDALIVDNGQPVEAKTGGLFGPLQEVWGEPGTDEVPDRINIQGQTQMLCTDSDVCHVAAFLGGRGFAMFILERSDKLIDIITDKCLVFWNDYVLKDIQPEDTKPSLQIIKSLIRVPNKVISIPDDKVVKWLKAKADRLAAEKLEEQAKHDLLAELGDAEAGECGTGIVTYFEYSRKGYEVKPSKFRSPKFKKDYKITNQIGDNDGKIDSNSK